MSAYEALAASYDALTYDIPYEDILTFWESLLRRNHVRPETVLDLACGTGSLSVLLAEKGYRVIGADISPDMLVEADFKASKMEGNRPFFICQPMQKLCLPERVDAAVCCLDSINYVTRPEECKRAFKRVWNALNPGGLFVFDINTPCKLKGLDEQIFMDETDDVYCVWRTEYIPNKKLCYYWMDIFQRSGESWIRSFEEHVEYAYEPEELITWLKEAGFQKVSIYGDRKLRKPSEKEQRIYFAAKKDEV